MFSPELLTYFTIGIYLAASIAGIFGLLFKGPLLRTLGRWLALGAFGCQTIILVLGFHGLFPQGLPLGAYLQLLAWFFLLAGIGAWLKFNQDAILLFSTPLAFAFFLLSAQWLRMPLKLPTVLSGSFYALHSGALFLALGLLALAFIASLLFLGLQKRIKTKKKLSGLWGEIPALSILEKIISFCSIACYPLYTLGILAGLAWSGPVFGSTLSGDPKEIVSILIWLLLTWLFYKKVVSSWQGRKPALLIVLIFLLSFFSIIFVNLYLPTHHVFLQ